IELINGERRYLSINGSPLQDGSGAITHVVFSITDITDRIQSEKVQQDALEFYRQTFESSPAIKLLIDPTTAEIVDANPAAANFYGYSIPVLKQMKITDINQQPLQDVLARMAETCFEKHCCWYFPHRLASGEIRQVEVHSSRVDLQGRELLYSIIHDVTDRQRFEDALKSQLKQEQLLEDVSQTIRRSLDVKVVLQTTVNQVQQMLGADRVIIYRPTTADHPGSVLVESCSPNYPPLLGWEMGDPATEYRRFIQPYQQGQYQALTDITHSELDPANVQLLEIFQVKSQLTIPILHTHPELLDQAALSGKSTHRENSAGKHLSISHAPQVNQIWGLLMVHHCASNHVWQDWEITLLQRLEMQLAVAIQQAEL
ncbi:MAG TPA: PAS domain S-box protein, partial [Allocoleopsis sp.]